MAIGDLLIGARLKDHFTLISSGNYSLVHREILADLSYHWLTFVRTAVSVLLVVRYIQFDQGGITAGILPSQPAPPCSSNNAVCALPSLAQLHSH